MLNHEGIELLKSDLRTNAKHYNQQKFGQITPECGTEACMAGMCLMRKLGYEEFTKQAMKAVSDLSYGNDFRKFMDACLDSAAKQLGLTLLSENEYESKTDGETELPPIFSEAGDWPEDLREEYYTADEKHDHQAMAEVACKALDRIDENGFFV